MRRFFRFLNGPPKEKHIEIEAIDIQVRNFIYAAKKKKGGREIHAGFVHPISDQVFSVQLYDYKIAGDGGCGSVRTFTLNEIHFFKITKNAAGNLINCEESKTVKPFTLPNEAKEIASMGSHFITAKPKGEETVLDCYHVALTGITHISMTSIPEFFPRLVLNSVPDTNLLLLADDTKLKLYHFNGCGFREVTVISDKLSLSYFERGRLSLEKMMTKKREIFKSIYDESSELTEGRKYLFFNLQTHNRHVVTETFAETLPPTYSLTPYIQNGIEMPTLSNWEQHVARAAIERAIPGRLLPGVIALIASYGAPEIKNVAVREFVELSSDMLALKEIIVESKVEEAEKKDLLLAFNELATQLLSSPEKTVAEIVVEIENRFPLLRPLPSASTSSSSSDSRLFSSLSSSSSSVMPAGSERLEIYKTFRDILANLMTQEARAYQTSEKQLRSKLETARMIKA